MTLAKSTQEAAPGRSSNRTGVQSFAASAVTLVVLLPVAIQTFVPHVADYLPAGWSAWLLGAAAVIAACSAGFARVMAIPGVNDWLRRHKVFQWLAANDVHAASVGVWTGRRRSREYTAGQEDPHQYRA